MSAEGQPADYRQVALHEVFCWWRNLAADALLTEIGIWCAPGIGASKLYVLTTLSAGSAVCREAG